MQLTTKYTLIGHHCTYFAPIKHVNQQCLNNIIPVMGKRYFIAALSIGYFKNSFAPKP